MRGAQDGSFLQDPATPPDPAPGSGWLQMVPPPPSGHNMQKGARPTAPILEEWELTPHVTPGSSLSLSGPRGPVLSGEPCRPPRTS